MPNQRLEERVSQGGFRRFWPMREAAGKDRTGKMQSREVFVDMLSGQGGNEKDVYVPHEHGWNASLPDLPSGDPGKQPIYEPPSQRYREQYDKIDWRQ